MDRRVTVGENLETSLQEISTLESVKEIQATIDVPEYTIKSYTGYTAKAKAFVPMWLMEKSHPLVQTDIEAYKSQFNLQLHS